MSRPRGVPSPSLSLYRGHSRTGIGEPGSPISHGEQYLAAAGELAADPALRDEILTAVRPWMSLDSDPAHHRKLDDRLEAWSCFPYRDWQFVVRLTSAGIYDRRAAYFAHGRAWPLAALGDGFDPGALLGDTDAFDPPWKDGGSPEQREPPVPALVRPEQVQAESEVAARLLGHLLQALVGGYPLVLAAPVPDFAAGGSLAALVSFARAALPAPLKQRCRIRVYSCLPEIFLGELAADLVVVPEEVAASALRARRDAALLDRSAQAHPQAGRPLSERALAYAEAVLDGAHRFPQGLLHFSDRFGRRYAVRQPTPELPSAEQVRTLQVTYNLATALAGPEQMRAEVLSQYLLKRAPQKLGELPWDELLTRADWELFPERALARVLLQDPEELPPGGRRLQALALEAACRRGLLLDDHLAFLGVTPGQSLERGKLGRLLALTGHEPPLLSQEGILRYLSPLPLTTLLAAGPVARVLAVESERERLQQRQAEPAALAQAATAPAVFDTLAQATSEGRLAPAWAERFVESESTPQPALDHAALRLLERPRDWSGWRQVPHRLFRRLRRRAVPPPIRVALLGKAEEIDPMADLDTYLELAELAEPATGGGGNPLVDRLVRKTEHFSAAAIHRLVQTALSGDWRCLGAPFLVDGRGEPRLGRWREVSDLLLADEVVRRHLSPPALLRLGEALPEEHAHLLERLHATLDEHMRSDRQRTTEALVEAGWWYLWRRRTTLGQEERRAVALAWLGAHPWRRRNGGETSSEATLEAWKAALADLAPGPLSGTETAELCADEADGTRRPAWPWIPPFEDEQLSDLCRATADLGALAEIAETVAEEEPFRQQGPRLHRTVLERSRFRGQVSAEALLWLRPRPPLAREPSPLTLEDSERLLHQAGHRQEAALSARGRAVAAHLWKYPREAARAAASPPLGQQETFLAGLAEWLARWESVRDIDSVVAAQLDRLVDPSRSPGATGVSERLIADLRGHGFHHLADCLRPVAGPPQPAGDSPEEEVVQALAQGDAEATCWRRLGDAIDLYLRGRVGGEVHPILAVADGVQAWAQRSIERRRQLREQGLGTLASAARLKQILLSQDRGGAPLPAFVLGARLAGPGGLGTTALALVTAAGDKYRGQPEWWQALLRGVMGFRRHGWVQVQNGEDRRDLALAVLLRGVEDLPTAGARKAFTHALGREIRTYLVEPLRSELEPWTQA